MSLSEILLREMSGIVELSEAQLSRLEEHYRLLLHWNARMNLTTVTKLPEAAIRHYCESLFLATHLSSGLVADVGSGPGFPGIPAAVLRSDCQFELIESHQRKAVFLKEATRGYSNVRVVSKRAQDLDRVFRWVIARAVDPTEVLELGIASSFALLLGADDASRIPKARVIPLPWGEKRVLAIVTRQERVEPD